MSVFNALLTKQGALALNDNRHALFLVLLLSIIPFGSYFSLAVIALVTLRNDWLLGGLLALALLVVDWSLSLFSMTKLIALTDSILTIIPCYLAACVLRVTTSWRAIFAVFCLLLMSIALVLQFWMPGFILQQFNYVLVLIEKIQPQSPLLELFQSPSNVDKQLMANYFFGIQALGIVFSGLFPLMLARSVQSTLYYPAGFAQEMLNFRGELIGLALLLIGLVASEMHYSVAINVLPLLIAYFFLAGISLSAFVFAQKNKLRFTLGLIVLFCLLPFVTIPTLALAGVLDSLFNFRLRLPVASGKS